MGVVGEPTEKLNSNPAQSLHQLNRGRFEHILIWYRPPHGSTDFGLKGLFGFTSVTQHTIGGSMEGVS